MRAAAVAFGAIALGLASYDFGHALVRVHAAAKLGVVPDETVSELGFALKVPLWGDGAKLEGVLNE